MQRGHNRLLMLLITAAIAGCASQTERSSSGTGAAADAVEYERVTGTSNVVTKEELERRAAAQAQAAAAPAAAEPEPAASSYEPQKEEVQYIDRPLEEAAPVAAAAAATTAAAASTTSAAEEALPDFPITKYEIEEPAQQAAADANEEVEDLGEQADDAVTTEGAAEEGAVAASGLSEPTEYPDEPEQAAEAQAEVEDLGTQQDDSGTVTHPEDSLAAQGSGISEPTVYPDEPAKPTALAVSVSFEAEPLFSFDKAAIREGERKALNDFVASLKGVDYTEIVAVGHADRIGTDSYNMGLSERRANAVKDYLVSRGISASKIRVEGRGESEPVTDGCKTGTRKAVIACLQPDRRVDVSVNGSRKN